MGIYERLRLGIIRGVTGIVIVSTMTSTAMSYVGLRDWAAGHGYPGFESWIFPGFIDTFPLAAEGVLILAYLDRWPARSRVMLWVVLTLGLVTSIGLNVGHVYVPDADFWTLVSSGLPPFATWLSLVVGTMAFKRTMANAPVPADELDAEPDDELEYVRMQATGPELKAAAEAFADDVSAGRVPGLNRIRATLGVGHAKAPVIQAHLRELATQNAA